MTFTVTGLGFCKTGGEHVHMTIHVGTRTIPVTVLKGDFTEDLPDLDDRIIGRLRSFVLESGLTNWAQLKAAIEAATFKV